MPAHSRRPLAVLWILVLVISVMAACSPAASGPTSGAPSGPISAPATSVPGDTPDAPGSPAGESAPATGSTTPSAAPQPSSPAPTGGTSDGEPLTIALTNDESRLTPFNYRFGMGLQMLYFVYDTVMYTDAQNQPQPLMAEEVIVSDDATTFDITLRSGLAWHDGEPLTAEDVRFTFEYFPETTASIGAALSTIESITVNDPASLTIQLTDPGPTFPLRALSTIPILPRHIWEPVPPADVEGFTTMVGSGAYRLIEASPETGYRMEANPDHFLGAPAVPEILWVVIGEQNAQLQTLQAGGIDALVREIPAELVEQFGQAPLALATGPSFASTLLNINDERAPFDREEVRRAIDLAIDKQALVDTLLLGEGIAASPGFLHPDAPAHDPALAPRFDQDAARGLLDGLGAEPGSDGVRVLDGERMEFELLTYSDNPIRSRAAELISTSLMEIGIVATVTSLDAAAVDEQVWPEFDVAAGRDYDLAMWGWSAPIQIDPTRLVDLVHSDPLKGPFNVTGLRSEAADELGDQILVAADDAERLELLRDLEVVVAEELPFVTLYFAEGVFGYRPEAYDGWVFQQGQGIFTRLSFLSGLAE